MPPLDGQPDPERTRALESLLAFWAEAGVETAYADAPVDRRRTPAPSTAAITEAPRAAPPPVATITAPLAPQRVAEIAEKVAAAGSLAELKALILEGLDIERPVLWRGSETPAVVVIGDFPSAEDDLAGEAFAGAAGRLLDRMLAAAGLDGRGLITNAVFQRPAGGAPPDGETQALALPILERVIALAAPRALLMLGAGAAKAVLRRDETILALRGRWIEWRSSDEAVELPALCTFSPAFLLRQQAAKRGAWQDILILSERIDRPERGG